MIAIIDYGIGNLASIHNIIRHVGGSAIITSESDAVKNATALIIPGIGHFDSCMNGFRASEIFDLVEKRVLMERIPVLGICVGMQMMAGRSEEGRAKGLEWIKGDVCRLEPPPEAGLKVPHLGWRHVEVRDNAKLFSHLDGERRFYFAHSYHVVCDSAADIAATCDFGGMITAGIQRDNIYAVQFHPEKSHRFGMQLFRNFLMVSGQKPRHRYDEV